MKHMIINFFLRHRKNPFQTALSKRMEAFSLLNNRLRVVLGKISGGGLWEE